MALDSLEDLLHHEIQDLYSAEKQLIKALPKMAKACTSPKLKSAFEGHLTQTEEQVARLEQVFEHLGKAARAKKCEAMEGLIKEGESTMEEKASDSVMDAALIACAQKVEHYEIASYGTAKAWADLLGMKEVAKLLQKTLDEEGATNEKLTKLAMSEINAEAETAE